MPAERLAATKHLLAIYEDVCPAYWSKCGAAYPGEQAAAVWRALAELDQLR